MTNMKVWSGFMLLLLSCSVLLLSEERGMQQNEGERKDPSLPQTTSGFAGKISGLETRVNSLVLNNVNEDNQPLRVYDSTDKLVRTISGTNGNVAVGNFKSGAEFHALKGRLACDDNRHCFIVPGELAPVLVL